MADAQSIPQTGDAVRFTDFARTAIRKRLKALLKLENPARSGEDQEALHQMRVASRRLRAALALLAPHLPVKRVKQAKRSIRKITRALGRMREWDVHQQYLARLHAAAADDVERAAIEHVAEFVERRRAKQHNKTVRAMDRIDLTEAADVVGSLSDRLDAGDVPADMAHAAWEALQPRIEAAMSFLPRLREQEVPDDLHQMRIEVKRLRYAIELLEPALHGRHEPLLARVKTLQELLGQYHDHDLLLDVLTPRLSLLNEHGRNTLAEGLTRALQRFAADHRAIYSEFVSVTEGLTVETFSRDVRIALGLEPLARIAAEPAAQAMDG